MSIRIFFRDFVRADPLYHITNFIMLDHFDTSPLQNLLMDIQVYLKK
jgi:hypothetical protein